ncbi:MAG: AAA domain-containing protein [Bacteroidales bacterium]|nr:AAA domain-containing protein [Bacteroidales bacterium]
MRYTRDEYERFLSTELETQQRDFEQIENTKAITLKERGAVFVGLFQGYGENGIPIFKVRNDENMPRKNSFWTAVDLRSENGNMSKFKSWGNLSWKNLRTQYQSDFCDCICVWISKSDNPDYCLVGIKDLTIEFVKNIEPNTIIAFGPKDPPLQYLLNLIDLVRDSSCAETQKILDYEETSNQWNPLKIEAKADFTSFLLNDMKDNNCIIVQGPPGTGKTYRMAQLAAKLLADNKSVLVTALTNQALMELAKKEDILPFLEKGKVSKTSLTVDERKELPKLQSIKDNLCNASQGNLSLATFYLSSGWAKELTDKPFDYVIMDEASQALLPMFAVTMKLGKKIVLIGDQNQLAPIVITNEDIINRFQWSSIVKGFETICNNFSFKSYMLSDTFRLTNRGAESTGIFYNNELRSVSETQVIPSTLSELNQKGGPVFVGLDMKVGDKAPKNAFDSMFDCVSKIIKETPKAEIAILSKFRESVRQMQKHFVIRWTATKELPENIFIETVDRVQGLTVDYCLFFIPNASIRYSLENKLFNVATSRAKYNTIIVADNSVLKENMSEEVRKYLLKSQEDKFATFEPQIITTGNIGLTIRGKIDLSQFERKRKELVEGKDNIYIIDTNVFVNCPDIISRIGNKYKIVIPAKVLEELDKLKLKADIDKKKLNEAAKNINTAFVKNYSKMEEANLSLLPKGFDRHNPDCMILSVALKYRNDNPILLTSDSILQSRASGLGITTISLKDFLKK